MTTTQSTIDNKIALLNTTTNLSIKTYVKGSKNRIYVTRNGNDNGYINMIDSKSWESKHKNHGYKAVCFEVNSRLETIIDFLFYDGKIEDVVGVEMTKPIETKTTPKITTPKNYKRRAGIDYPCPKCGGYCFGDCTANNN